MASVKNAAARFNVTPEYVRKLCRTGKICYTAISSRKWLVNMDTLAQFFAQGEPVREDSQQVTNGLVLDSDMLLDDLIDRWFEEYANKQLKAKTLYDYRRMRGRISAGLGHLKVSKIKPAHVMAFYNNLEEKGVRRDSTYTATKALLKLLPRGTRGELAKQGRDRSGHHADGLRRQACQPKDGGKGVRCSGADLLKGVCRAYQKGREAEQQQRHPIPGHAFQHL